MHADVDEARLQHLLVGRVDELLVVHPPRVLALVLVSVVTDGVALERVGLELSDRAVHFLQPAGIAGREDRMRHQPPRAEPRVHLGARVHRHVIGEEPVLRHLGGRTRDERDLGVRVEEDLLEVIVELQVLKRLRLTGEAGIPSGPSHRLALAHEALETRVVAEEMRVGVHHELPGQALGPLRRHVLVGGLGQARVEEGAEHLVHGHIGRRHPAGGAEEGAAREPPPAAELVAQSLRRAPRRAAARRSGARESTRRSRRSGWEPAPERPPSRPVREPAARRRSGASWRPPFAASAAARDARRV